MKAKPVEASPRELIAIVGADGAVIAMGWPSGAQGGMSPLMEEEARQIQAYLDRWLSDKQLDPYYYAKSERGGWCVRGTNGLVIDPPEGLDKNVAYVIGKMLSGKFADALALLRDLPPPR